MLTEKKTRSNRSLYIIHDDDSGWLTLPSGPVGLNWAVNNASQVSIMGESSSNWPQNQHTYYEKKQQQQQAKIDMTSRPRFIFILRTTYVPLHAALSFAISSLRF